MTTELGEVPPAPAPDPPARRAAPDARLRAERSLGRQRLRRRIVPPLVVGSTALLGGAGGAAWVSGLLPGPASSAATPHDPARAAKALQQEVAHAQAVEQQAITRIRLALRSDAALAASLSGAAARAVAAGDRTTVVNEVSSAASAGAPGAPAAAGAGATPTAGLPAASAGGSVTGLPALPALPSLPPLPSFSVPSTQGTTGATHVVP